MVLRFLSVRLCEQQPEPTESAYQNNTEILWKYFGSFLGSTL